MYRELTRFGVIYEECMKYDLRVVEHISWKECRRELRDEGSGLEEFIGYEETDAPRLDLLSA